MLFGMSTIKGATCEDDPYPDEGKTKTSFREKCDPLESPAKIDPET